LPEGKVVELKALDDDGLTEEERAEADVEEIAKWWSKHRDVGAGLFFEELEEA
jgi:hypothetical protein